MELQPAGVRVTTLCAGSIDTPFFDRFRPTLERPRMLRIEDAVRCLMHVLTSPPHVLHGEVVLRPRRI
jgi:NAD(P)-dependent dehydrogenase (short-subunit alcohol dehydrogenase family)